MKTKSDPMANMSIFEKFEVENARILRETEEVEKENKKKRGEWEAKIAEIKVRRVRAAAEHGKLTAEYEGIEAKVLAGERQRAEAKSVKMEDVKAGRASLQDLLDRGLTDAEIAVEVRKAADVQLAALMQVIRTKARDVLRLEVEEGEAGKGLIHVCSYGPQTMLERMKSQVKSLEAVMGSIAGAGGYMPMWADLDTKKLALARGTGNTVKSERWNELDLEAVKKLRMDPGIPEDEIPTLLNIITEMEARPGFKIDLLHDPMDGRPAFKIAMWRAADKKAGTS